MFRVLLLLGLALSSVSPLSRQRAPDSDAPTPGDNFLEDKNSSLGSLLELDRVALHACGVATDMVMEHCIQARAAFVISPCCYGFIQNAIKFTFPKSKRFKETLTYKEHMILCRFADQTAVQLPPEKRLIGKQCMGLVDLDRSWVAQTHGYTVQVMTMEPESCSPKNNMLVGRLKSGLQDDAGQQEAPAHN